MTRPPLRIVHSTDHPVRVGQLAAVAGYRLPLEVLSSPSGYYIGTSTDDGPVSRESVEYFGSLEAARKSLDSGAWTQRESP